jgi:pimeloyl-ACP methyl ester carboxylesterase
MNPRRAVTVACAGLLLLAACTGSESVEPVFRPSIEWVECPSDVEIQMLTRHRCGYLTVLQDRSEPGGARARLFLTEVYPAGSTPPASHVGSGFESDLGRVTGLGDTGAGATRVNSIVYSLSGRGLGLSEPSLACPEVDEVDAQVAAAPSGDPEVLAEFTDAVGACGARLESEGVDLADFRAEVVAADMDDLRVALGIDRWYFLNSYGTNARYLFEYLRAFPDHVRAAWMDSPQFPQVDEISGGVSGTRYALDELFRACERVTACARAYPGLEAMWKSALDRLARTPLEGSVRDPAGARLDVSVDDATLLRAARSALGGDGTADLSHLPAIIAAAARGRLTDELAEIVVRGTTFCAGYHPLCAPSEEFSLGNYLSVLCGDEAPFIEPATVSTAAAGDPSYEQVFVDHPFLAACDAWGVPSSGPTVHEPVSTDVPLLILPGQFDSFSPPPVATTASETFSTAWVVEVPWQTHNTLGFSDCPIEIRNAWIIEPTSPPGTACLKDMPAIEFSASGSG